MNNPSPFYILGCFALSVAIGYVIYTTGFVYGINAVYYGVNKPHVKKRIIKEGNILKYPFGTQSREAEKTGDSDSICESGIVSNKPEKEEKT